MASDSAVGGIGHARDDEALINLFDDGDFVGGPRHQNDPVGLQTLALARVEYAFGLALVIDQQAAKPIARHFALAEAEFDQAALTSEDL